MRIAVGCPIFEREWCFDQWADSVEAQAFDEVMGMEVEHHFVYSPGKDDTIGAIRRRFPHANVVIADDVPTFRNDQRSDSARYAVLADLRNRLLGEVRESEPDFFLSWDSDMIFPPRTLPRLFIDKPIAGALVEMLGEDWMFDSVPEGAFASFMYLDPVSHVAHRPSRDTVDLAGEPFRVGVVMGTVLFERQAYELVEYAFHPQGEDIGLALRAEKLGLSRWLVPAARGVHLHDRPGDRDS